MVVAARNSVLSELLSNYLREDLHSATALYKHCDISAVEQLITHNLRGLWSELH